MMRPQSNHHPLWVQWAQQNPLQPALVTTHRTYTWQQVFVLVSEYQQQLSHQGLSEGDVLTIVGKNQAEVILFTLPHSIWVWFVRYDASA